ncbi:MAG: ATP-dependent RecD-like DNA helicase [Ruminococcus sp.]|nr:ATP-dependent RecD-like DNA helicase [Ruminococcus sp.]MDE6785244.1 ATP-dependent RecD-like DNA helicase [Ruminococcus sp.]
MHIEGSVENIVFRNTSNGYVVLDLDSGGEMIPVFGNLGDIDEGEMLSLEGEYINKGKYGIQFSAEYCERKLPQDKINIEKYLASGAVRGIGPGLARKIVQTFGDQTLEIIEKNPQRLREVKGISQQKCDEIAAEAAKLFSLRILTSYLSGFDIKPADAMKTFRKYGSDSIQLIKLNPYVLCSDSIGIDFGKADSVASSLDIPRNAQSRIIAGMQCILRAFALYGNSCMLIEHLLKTVSERLEISEKEFYEAYNTAIDNNDLYNYVIDDSEFVYLPDYFIAEQFIADRIHILNDFAPPEDFDFNKLIDDEEKKNSIKYAEKQRTAINMAMSRGIMILTGGPGTGKTTTLNAVISLLEKRGCEVLLTAPTGRAAKRMSDLTGRDAKTIHRLLEAIYDQSDNLVFARNEKNPLKCDAVIVDEMSMVDSLLFEKLLRALRIGCKLIMVGDFNQLPSVGAGNLLKDMIQSGAVPTVELTEIFRQAQKSCIITNAHKIVAGEYPDITQKNNDFFFFSRNDYGKATELIVDLIKRRLPNAYNYSPLNDIQIIAPSRKGTVGTIELNRILQEHLNPPDGKKAEYRYFSNIYRKGDKVMQTRNNYNIPWTKDDESGMGIYNGDIGRIISISVPKQSAVIDFDGRIAEYPFDILPQVELAYAITVHKSQGCEFEAVIMPVMGVFQKLAYRNLLYTAVTRAKKLLILVGTEKDIEKMVDNDKRTLRYSCLKKMLA